MGGAEDVVPTVDYSSAAAAASGVAEPTGAAAASAANDRPSLKYVSWGPEPGLQPVCVRYAPASTWCQKTLWASPNCNSDHLKWHLASWLGANVSTWRVHEGWSGMPFDRFTPVLDAAPGADPSVKNKAPLVIAQSFGP